jgi:hypothetical protein
MADENGSRANAPRGTAKRVCAGKLRKESQSNRRAAMTNRAKKGQRTQTAQPETARPDTASLDGAQAIAAIRERAARKLMAVLEYPRRCRDTRCRRVNRCVGPTMRCADDFPKPRMTAEEQAAALARFQAALKQAIARPRAQA